MAGRRRATRSMNVISPCICAGVAAWCSLGAVGLVGQAPAAARLVLLPPWWLLPILIAAAFAAVGLARLTPTEILPFYTSALAILPWLPAPLPAAALVWTGPFVIAVWCAVGGGLVMTIGRPIRGRWILDPPRARILAGALALALYGASAWWLSEIPPDGDAPHYLILTQSLLRDGDLRIENNHQRGDYLDYYPGALKPDYLRRGINGAIYSIHAPGLPVLIAPAFFLFGLPGALALLAAIGAAATGLVWHTAHRITGSAGTAWFAWACSALTVPFFFAVTEIFPDGLAATFVLLGMLPLLDPVDPEADRPSWPLWLVSGTSLAILPWLGTRLVAISVAAGICLAFRIRSVRQAACIAVPAVAGAASWFGYFYVIYGTVNPSAPYGPYTQLAAATLVRSVPGLLFDQQFGLIPGAPVYGFVLAGIIAAALRRHRWAFELLIVLVPYLIAVGMFQIWWGATSAPGRYWAPLALLLGVAAARVWHGTRVTVNKAMGLMALGASVLVACALLVPERGALLSNPRDGVARWLEWANDLVDLPGGVPSVFRDSTGRTWMIVAIWGGSLLAAWLALRAIDARGARGWTASRRLSVLSVATPWCLAVAAMMALSVSWHVETLEPRTPETGQISLLRHASAFRPVAYDYGARRLESAATALSATRLRTPARRTPLRAAPLLALSHLPAGTYRVNLVAAGEADGTLVVRVGATAPPLQAWSLSGAHAGEIGAPIRLPVEARSFVIDGDERARRTVASLELIPVPEPPAGRQPRALSRTPGAAASAAGYGSAEVFFLDEHAFAEPGGFWVGGGQDARVVVANRTPPLRLFLRNAPVLNTVVIEAGGERRELTLHPGEETIVDLTGTGGAEDTVVRVQTRSGFRPWQTDHTNADMRYLGCWVEIR